MPLDLEKEEQQALRAGRLACFSGQISFMAARVQKAVSRAIESNAAGASDIRQMVFPIAEASMLAPEDVRAAGGSVGAGGYLRVHEVCARPALNRKVEVLRVPWQGTEYTSLVVSLDSPYSASPEAKALGRKLAARSFLFAL